MLGPIKHTVKRERVTLHVRVLTHVSSGTQMWTHPVCPMGQEQPGQRFLRRSGAVPEAGALGTSVVRGARECFLPPP